MLDSALEAASGPTKTREHVVVRKRRRLEKLEGPRWAARRSIRRTLRMVAVCAAALALMIAVLLFGLTL